MVPSASVTFITVNSAGDGTDGKLLWEQEGTTCNQSLLRVLVARHTKTSAAPSPSSWNLGGPCSHGRAKL